MARYLFQLTVIDSPCLLRKEILKEIRINNSSRPQTNQTVTLLVLSEAVVFIT